MKTNSNTYTIIYSAIIVVVVAFLLAFVSQALKAKQDANVALDVKKQILNSLNIRGLGDSEAEAKYGEVVKSEEAVGEQKLYTCEIDGQPVYVCTVKGMGLWGPVFGYISVAADKNTVYGAYFNHDSETAGLGAEIKDSQAWQEKFKGKKINADDDPEIELGVAKKIEVPESEVDAVTGATNDMSSLFSKENQEVFKNPLNLDNPILVQVLGICSALAVTAQLKPAIVMGLAVTIITAFSNVIISIIRNTIPTRIRIIVQLVVVAALVTIVSQVLKAFAYDVSVQLSVYVGLIITNCILMGRLEAFAMQNKPWPSFLDGIANGIGYAMILVIVGAFREFFGFGTLLGFKVLPQAVYDAGYMNNGMMTMPAMALILVGCVIWVHRAFFYKEK